MGCCNAARARLARVAYALSGGALPALVLFCDDDRLAAPLAAVEALPPGALVVVRARQAEGRAALAHCLRPIARRRRLYLLIAGEGALARRLGLGLHLPETRLAEAVYWRARGVRFITSACHSLSALARAQRGGVDAAFLSPIFATQSHPGGKVLGPVRANLMVAQVPLPVYALGGVKGDNASRLAGFIGCAGIEALIA